MPSRKTSWTKTQRATFVVALITAAGVIGASLIGILPNLLQIAHAPTATPLPLLYSGRIKDAVSGEPISGAKVTLEVAPVPLTRYTDAEGVYVFALPKQTGEITARLSVTHPHYQPYERTVLLNPQNRQIDDIRLTAATGQTGADASSTIPNTVGVWKASFFNNAALEGAPIYQTTLTATPNGEGGYTLVFSPLADHVPGLASAYSARWVGLFDFTKGAYEFHCEHRDGCRVYLDNRVWIDAWWDGDGGHDLARDVIAGQHIVIVEFYDKSGVGHLEVLWRKK